MPSLISFDYPVSRAFPWRSFTLFTLLGSTIVFIALTVLNFAAVGHEPIATVSPVFFNASRSWWSSISQRKDAGCSPANFLLGDSFYSSVGSFPYRVLSVAPPVGAVLEGPQRWSVLAPPDSLYGFTYSGRELGEDCYNPDLSLDSSRRFVSVSASFATMEVTSSIRFHCSNPGALVQVSLSHSTQALAFRPPSSAFSTTRALESQVSFFGLRDTLKTVVDGFGLDLLASMAASTSAEGARVETLLAEGYMSCLSPTDGAPQPTLACDSNTAPQLVLQSSRGVWASPNGSTSLLDLTASSSGGGGYSQDTQAALRTSISNYVAALHAANIADLGGPTGSSIFRWPALFNSSISSNAPVSSFYTSASTPSIWTTTLFPLSLGDGGTRSSFADYLRASPTLSFTSAAFGNATIGVNFLCNELKLKKPVNLIVSIAVANVSLFSALWTFFFLLATLVAKRRSGANICEACAASTFPVTHQCLHSKPLPYQPRTPSKGKDYHLGVGVGVGVGGGGGAVPYQPVPLEHGHGHGHHAYA